MVTNKGIGNLYQAHSDASSALQLISNKVNELTDITFHMTVSNSQKYRASFKHFQP